MLLLLLLYVGGGADESEQVKGSLLGSFARALRDGGSGAGALLRVDCTLLNSNSNRLYNRD